MNNIDLNRRHAFITRDAQGIGLAISRRILASGASVSLWAGDVKLLASEWQGFELEGRRRWCRSRERGKRPGSYCGEA